MNFLELVNKRLDKEKLSFITCGSVDDGKSTLIGRLLNDSKSLKEDVISQSLVESKKFGTQGNKLDFALLVDGLQAEREQGITIDVAYRYFETSFRKFIAIDCPGHEQYTRNMITGASNADIAVILVDAKKGILEQTKRHSKIIELMGIDNIILLVNKMDLIHFNEQKFNNIQSDYLKLINKKNKLEITSIPISALKGDDVFHKSKTMLWYKGKTFIDVLNKIKFSKKTTLEDFIFPVQWVNRPNSSFRGYSGKVISGHASIGDTIYCCRTKQYSKITKILTPQKDEKSCYLDQSISLCIEKELDISRGDILVSEKNILNLTDQFACNIMWFDEQELIPEREYTFLLSTTETIAKITKLEYQVDINSDKKLATKTLKQNQIGYCKVTINKPIVAHDYKTNKNLGSFILIDRITNNTVGAGTIVFSLRRSENLFWQNHKINKKIRSENKNQKSCIIWFTGLSGSGKSTIADKLEQKLNFQGKHTYILDGDNIRHGLNKDLGFTDEARVENIRRVAEVGKLMVDAGLITIVAFISPFNQERMMARRLFKKEEFFEVFIDTPLEVCKKRDPKGLYKKALAGKIKNFTGIDSKYEKPKNAELRLKGDRFSPNELSDQIMDFLSDKI